MASDITHTRLGADRDASLLGWLLMSVALVLGLIGLVAWMLVSTPPPQGGHDRMPEPARFVIPQ